MDKHTLLQQNPNSPGGGDLSWHSLWAQGLNMLLSSLSLAGLAPCLSLLSQPSPMNLTRRSSPSRPSPTQCKAMWSGTRGQNSANHIYLLISRCSAVLQDPRSELLAEPSKANWVPRLCIIVNNTSVHQELIQNLCYLLLNKLLPWFLSKVQVYSWLICPASIPEALLLYEILLNCQHRRLFKVCAPYFNWWQQNKEIKGGGGRGTLLRFFFFLLFNKMSTLLYRCQLHYCNASSVTSPQNYLLIKQVSQRKRRGQAHPL